MDDPAGRAFQRHYAQIFRYLRRRTPSDEAAEDLAQAVFADAAERLPQFLAGSSPVLAWLYTVARRRLADAARHASSAPQTVAGLELVRARSAEEPSYGTSLASVLREAIEQLPSGQRDVVVMKLLEGRPFAEIARTLGASEAACKMRFARGLAALRDELAKSGVEP